MKRLTIFLLVFVFFFAQCKKTDEILPNLQQPERIENKQIEPLVTTLNKDEVLNDTTFQKMISGMGTLEIDNLLLKSGTTNPVTEIKLIWDKVKKISTTGYMSYTFLIYQPNQNGNFSNLILEYKGLKHNIIKLDYFPEKKYLNLVRSGIETKYNGKIGFSQFNSNEIKLKSVYCRTVQVIQDVQCNCSPKHWPGENCSCEYGKCYSYSFDIVFCSETGTSSQVMVWGGGADLTDTTPTNGNTTSPGSGNGPSNNPNPDSYTTPVDPNFNQQLNTEIKIVENELGIDVIDQCSPSVNQTMLDGMINSVDDQNKVAVDPSGGIMFKSYGRHVYSDDSNTYIKINDLWYTANDKLNKIADDFIATKLGYQIITVSSLISGYFSLEQWAILMKGSDFENVQRNRYAAAGILLFEYSAGKVLKPILKVTDAVGNVAFRFAEDIADNLLDLVKVNGIFKFADDAVQKLAVKATKNGDKPAKKVLLGKFYGRDNPLSYTSIAENGGYCYYDLDKWDELHSLVNLNDEQMFLINKKFIDNQLNAGYEIYFSFNPWKSTGFLQDEGLYLIDKGAKDFKEVSPGLWKVIF